MASTQTTQTTQPRQSKPVATASYKNRQYLLHWQGTTKTGKNMAKLGFHDGSKEFWVDLSLVSHIEPITDKSYTCDQCNGPTSRPNTWCFRCTQDEMQ